MMNEKRGKIKEKIVVSILSFGILAVCLAILFSLSPVLKLTGNVIGNAAENLGQTLGLITNQVNVNFSQDIGVIGPDFYGVNTHGMWLGSGTMVDANSDGILDTPSNLTWNQQAFLDSGMKYMRWDMGLENFYKNGTNNSFQFTGNLSSGISQLQWDNDNGIRVLLIVDFMPSWLADNSAGCATLNYCSPTNYTLFGQMVTDYLGRLTQNGTYASDVDIEVWNEPDVSDLLDAINTDNQAKANTYINLYNSIYDSVKERYPSISIGGPAVAYLTSSNMIDSFLSNESNRMDFFSFHKYTDTAGATFSSSIQNIKNNCIYYQSNCSRIIISEWNTYNSTTKSDASLSNEFASNIANGYVSMLNTDPSQISMLLYQWSQNYKYSNSEYYPEYPQLWSMVSEPQLDNMYYPSYNVTKDFANYQSPGSTIINSSSNNDNIRVVASAKDQVQHIIIINAGSTEQSNVLLDIQDTNVTIGLEDLKTGDNYSFVNGVTDLGTIPAYGIKYLVSADVTTSSNSNQNNNSNSSTKNSNSRGASSSSGGPSSVQETTTQLNSSGYVNDKNNLSINNDYQSFNNLDNSNNNQSNNKSKLTGQVTANGENYLARILGGEGSKVILIFLIATVILLGLIVFLISLIKREEMIDQQRIALKSWIPKARKAGYQDEHLQKTLTDHGWHKKAIRKALEERGF